MGVDVKRSALQLGVAGFEFNRGGVGKRVRWLMIANDLVVGQQTGSPITVDWWGAEGHDQEQVPYGTWKAIPMKAYKWLISGNGSFVDFTDYDQKIEFTVEQITPPTQVQVSIANDTVGLAKAVQLPVSLDGGFLQVAIEKPLGTPGAAGSVATKAN